MHLTRSTRFGAIAAIAALAFIPAACSKATVKAVDTSTTAKAGEDSSTTTTAKPPTDATSMRSALLASLEAASGGTFPKDQATCWVDTLMDKVGFDHLNAIKLYGFSMGSTGIELSKLSDTDLATYLSSFDECVDLYEVLVASINTPAGTDTKPITDCLKSIDNQKTANAFARWLAEGVGKDPSTEGLDQQLSTCFNPTPQGGAAVGDTTPQPADLSPTAPTSAAPTTTVPAAPTTAGG